MVSEESVFWYAKLERKFASISGHKYNSCITNILYTVCKKRTKKL